MVEQGFIFQLCAYRQEGKKHVLSYKISFLHGTEDEVSIFKEKSTWPTDMLKTANLILLITSIACESSTNPCLAFTFVPPDTIPSKTNAKRTKQLI